MIQSVDEEIELFHDWDSFQSLKVRICLSEKQLAWIDKRVILGQFEHLQPDYLTLNPQGVVPTLRHRGTVVCESSIINEYLEDAFPDTPLRPSGAGELAAMRLWCKFEDDVVHPSVRLASFNLMLKQRVKRIPQEQLEDLLATHPWPERAAAYRKAALSDIDADEVFSAISSFRSIIMRLENSLGSKSWLASDCYSLADIAMTPFIDRLEWLGMSDLFRDAPKAASWTQRIRSRPSYSTSVAPSTARMPAPDASIVAEFLKRAAI